MRDIRIVADSSANLINMQNTTFAYAPLKIIADQREFVDDEKLDLQDMLQWFDSYKGRSQTSCPNPDDWLHAFADSEEIFCVTITSGLSGSYNAACIAKQMYEAEHPQRRVYVIDSLSAGPELVLIIEKLEECIALDMSFDAICQTIDEYKSHTGLVFMLESLKNFAANGRVAPSIAKIAGVLGIRIVGKASDHGTLEPMNKCRGEAKSLSAIAGYLHQSGFSKGKLRIAHCQNETAAAALTQILRQSAPEADIQIHACRGLCSYYAEKGGLLIGFEKK